MNTPELFVAHGELDEGTKRWLRSNLGATPLTALRAFEWRVQAILGRSNMDPIQFAKIFFAEGIAYVQNQIMQQQVDMYMDEASAHIPELPEVLEEDLPGQYL